MEGTNISTLATLRPNIVPSVLHVAFYLMLSTIPSRYFPMHFADEETGSERLNIC